MPELSGQIVGEPSSKEYLIRAGDSDLAEDRTELRKMWLRDAKRIAGYAAAFYSSLKLFVDDPNKFTVADTAMLSQQTDRAIRKIQSELGPVMRAVDDEIRESVRRTIWKASMTQARHLRKKGLPVPTQRELQIIREEALLGLDRDFPRGTGVTYADRMLRIEEAHSSQLSNLIRSSHTESAKQRVVSDLKHAITHKSQGRTPVKGGSLTKKLSRVLVAEEMRLANEVEVGIIRQAGIRYAYWRLNPMHKWYGGGEICEVHASEEPDSITQAIVKASVGVTEGLHRLDQWPVYPHPYCMCFAEPASI